MNILRQFGIKLERVDKNSEHVLTSDYTQISQSNLENIISHPVLSPLEHKQNPFLKLSPFSQSSSNNNDDFHVFIDGSAINNGSAYCKAGYAVIFPNHEHLNIAEKLNNRTFVATNNRAEYMACIRALEQADTEDSNRKMTLVIHSDSKLLIDSMTKWIKTWKKNNWLKSDGKKVLNRDLLERLCDLLNHRKVIWKHVRAHTGGQDYNSIWNDVADKMAKHVVSLKQDNLF